jgi:uncharacterized protein YkwD/uncharacterized membrane protein required for colicin V production
MSLIDWVIIAVLMFYFYDGYRRGFLELLSELLSFLISIYLALKLESLVGSWITNKISLPDSFKIPVGFFVSWFFIQLLLSIGIKLIYKYIPRLIRNSKINKFGGAIISETKGFLFMGILILFFVSLPMPKLFKDRMNNSIIGGLIAKQGSLADGFIHRQFGNSVKDMAAFLTVEPSQVVDSKEPLSRILQPDERLYLGYKTVDVKADEVSEKEMLDLVNTERVKRGLTVLKFNSAAQQVARAHARDMFAKGYFSHINMEGLTPFDRMDNYGIKYKMAGENLALAPNVDLAHSGLMNSPGHRANILESKFGQLGVGVMDAGKYGKIFVQIFKD